MPDQGHGGQDSFNYSVNHEAINHTATVYLSGNSVLDTVGSIP